MRYAAIVSLLLAAALAVAAVYGARTWLVSERNQLIEVLEEEERRQGEAPKDTIVVAAEQIQFGERIVGTALVEIEWSGAIRPEGSYEQISDLIIGDTDETVRFAVTPMAVGEPVLASKVTEPGQRAKLSTALEPGKKAVSIRVNDVLGVAGFVLPGDRVDVLLTRDEFVDVLLQGLKVLAIDQIADELKDNPSVVRTVTFEVNTQEAQKLVLGGNVGTLSLALRNVGSADIEQIARVTIDDLSDVDVADDLVEARLNEIRNAAAQGVSDDRLRELESSLGNVLADLSAKLDQVEAKLKELESPNTPVRGQLVFENIDDLLPPDLGECTIGVIRNGQRNEYKVDRTDLEQDADVVEEAVTE